MPQLNFFFSSKNWIKELYYLFIYLQFMWLLYCLGLYPLLILFCVLNVNSDGISLLLNANVAWVKLFCEMPRNQYLQALILSLSIQHSKLLMIIKSLDLFSMQAVWGFFFCFWQCIVGVFLSEFDHCSGFWGFWLKVLIRNLLFCELYLFSHFCCLKNSQISDWSI